MCQHLWKKKKKGIILHEVKQCSYTSLLVTIIAYWPAQRLVIHESNTTPLYTWSSQWPASHEDQPGMTSLEIRLHTGKGQPREEAELICHVTDMSKHSLSYTCESDWENLRTCTHFCTGEMQLLLCFSIPAKSFQFLNQYPKQRQSKSELCPLKKKDNVTNNGQVNGLLDAENYGGLQFGPVLVLCSNL